MKLKLNVSGHCNPAPCQEEPVAYDGPRMEVVEWRCRVCQNESIAFYDLDLIVKKSKRSIQLREKLFSDDAFRALCVKKARYDRIQGMSVKTHREKAERCLRRLYGKHTQFPVTDYAALFLRLRALPDEVERTTIAQCLERHGQVLLHNEPYQIPGMKEIAGKRFMRPDKHNFVTHEWPLKRYFFAMNRRLLRYGIAWAVEMEEYRIVSLLQSRLSVLVSYMPDFSCASPDGEITKEEREAAIREEHYETHEDHIAPFRKELEKPLPKMPSGKFKPYPHPLAFEYYDFDTIEGTFTMNEEKYYVGSFADYDVLKLQISRSEKKIFQYGHVHYIIRSKSESGQYCKVILLLVNGDTVVNAFYKFNTTKKITDWSYLNIRKDYDAELMELAIRHLLTYLLPPHFKVVLNADAVDEP